MSCQHCTFFKNVNMIGMGKCYRFPPIPTSIVTGNGNGSLITTEIKSILPEVYESHICGEFQQKVN